ncbi:MAG: hypothetical protein DMG06_13570 [Acidobacteria bacterium]|nr:MAG: hypothetical protein DMG06_13570 [Acidobacteriota bacterium]
MVRLIHPHCALLAVIFFAAAVDAAAPRIIIARGKPLDSRVTLSDWEENLRLMLASRQQQVSLKNLSAGPTSNWRCFGAGTAGPS